MIDRAIVPLVVLVIGAANAFAFRSQFATQRSFLLLLLGPYLAFAGLALWRMWRDGTLLDLFRFRAGDISLGALVAGLLYAATFAGRTIFAPSGSAQESWVIRIYLQLGELPEARDTYLWVSLGVVAVALAEELTWRGLVQQVLEERLGTKRGWLATTALYGLAHVPTVWLLAMPGAGKNPLLVLAALFCGLIWGFIVGRIQRLPPSLISHAFFTFAVAMQFRLWK